MNQNNTQQNQRIQSLFEGYRRGFAEIEKLVNGFEGMSEPTTGMYVDTRIRLLNHQLKILDEEKAEIYDEVKEYLAKANSSITALMDLEEYIRREIADYQQLMDTLDDSGKQ